MRSNSVPTSTFTYKADVASSEGANNVVLAQIYNDLCPVKTPPQIADPRVRQTIDGYPIVMFWDNGSGTKFVGKYNANNDKGTEEVFGFTTGDESWEILQNGTERTGFRSADFSGSDWKNDFEARYPEDNVDTTNLKAFAEWLVSTNANAATGETLNPAVTYDGVEYTTDSAEYRLAKFKMELADHANVDAMVYYYVITELFLCIDQREKNAFPTLWKNDPNHWMMLFYDADSSLGIDNKGNLAFDYYLEDIDYTEAGDPVFNGQASVLWVNLRECFYDEIMAEYKRLRTTIRGDGSGNPLLSYDVVNDLFEAHQGKWSEAIYNEDGYRKSIEPYALNGDTLYLPMLQGKKEQQRKWWLYNRFRYLDSKYNTGSSMETRITMRAHAQANIELMAYVNMYGHVYYNAEMAEHRMTRGQKYEFEWAATGAEDAVIGINDADMLTDLGDLSPLMIELIDISKATHLTSLKVGDASEGYVNRNLNSITLGNNILMRTLDLRNCVNLAQSVDASGCTNIEEIYCDGTAVTGVSLPNGGNLRVLHLPETVSNLTIRNQTKMTDFTMPSYVNVSTLWLENNSSVVDSAAILTQMASGGRARVIGLDMSFENAADFDTFIRKLDSMRGIDESGNNVDVAQLVGKVHAVEINFSTYSSMDRLQEKYPNLEITYDEVLPSVTHMLISKTLTGEYVNDRVTTCDIAAFSAINTTTYSLVLPNVTDIMHRGTTAPYSFGTGLTSIRMDKLTSLNHYRLLYGCDKLTKVYFPSAIGSTGQATFSNAYNLDISQEDIPLITGIGYTDLISTGRNLSDKTTHVWTGIETVGNAAYSYYHGSVPKYVDFHKVKSIGSGCFGTTPIIALILRTESVVTLGGALGGSNPIVNGTGYIYVPRALVDSYKTATNWSTYAAQFRALEDYTVDGTRMGDLDESKI